MKKIIIIICVILAVSTAIPMRTYAAPEGIPKLGDTAAADITWSRTSEPNGYINLKVAEWSWSDVEGIDTFRTSDVWDGGTLGDRYIKDARRPWDIATWHTNRSGWTDGSCEVRRFRGEFSIPDGYSVNDDVMLSSAGDYSALGLDDIIAINDNIYIFIYPKTAVINDSNYLDYFAFWTGTALQPAATAANGGTEITFHGIPGTTPYDYKLTADGTIPPENLLSHTDGWYCEAFQNNVGGFFKKNPDASEFVLDLFIEDFAEDGGMDRLDLTFTKTTAAPELPPAAGIPEVLPPVQEPEVLPPVEEIPEVLPPVEETPVTEPDIAEESPKTGDSALLPYSIMLMAAGAYSLKLLRKRL